MGPLEMYREIVERILTEYKAFFDRAGGIPSTLIFDRERDHYLLMEVGWNPKRVYVCVFHVDIINGKFWIQCDNTDRPIACKLLAAGVPRDQIVLAFHPPELRQYSEYAVA